MIEPKVDCSDAPLGPACICIITPISGSGWYQRAVVAEFTPLTIDLQ